MDTKINETSDFKGLSCPMPMMKFTKTMKGMLMGLISQRSRFE